MHYHYGDTELKRTSLETRLQKMGNKFQGPAMIRGEIRNVTLVKIQSDKMQTENLPTDVKKNWFL